MDGLRRLVRYGVENGAEAFVDMWEDNFGALSSEIKDRMLTYDYKALLAVAQDRESLEDVLPKMRMPCLLYVGEMDEVYSKVLECSKQISNATFVTLQGLDHGEAIRRSDEVLPQIKRFLSGCQS